MQSSILGTPESANCEDDEELSSRVLKASTASPGYSRVDLNMVSVIVCHVMSKHETGALWLAA